MQDICAWKDRHLQAFLSLQYQIGPLSWRDYLGSPNELWMNQESVRETRVVKENDEQRMYFAESRVGVVFVKEVVEYTPRARLSFEAYRLVTEALIQMLLWCKLQELKATRAIRCDIPKPLFLGRLKRQRIGLAHVGMLMQKKDGVTLCDALQYITLEDFRRILEDVAQCLFYLQRELSFFHGDLFCRNVMVKSPKEVRGTDSSSSSSSSSRPSIIDFGWSVVMVDDRMIGQDHVNFPDFGFDLFTLLGSTVAQINRYRRQTKDMLEIRGYCWSHVKTPLQKIAQSLSRKPVEITDDFYDLLHDLFYHEVPRGILKPLLPANVRI